MRALQQIWEDVRQGENIDLYLTVVVALVLAAANILGWAPSTWLAPITLAVLALLAVSNLKNRHMLESILQEKSAESLFLMEYPPILLDDIRAAKELYIMGVNLTRTVTNLYPDLEAKLTKGDKVKILLVNPGGVANKLLASRLYYPTDEQGQSKRILATLSSLAYLVRIKPKQLEVRTLDYPIAFGVFATNLNSSDGAIYMEQYGFKAKRDDIPKLVLRPKDGRWFEQYREQVLALWENATPWKFSDTDTKQ